MPGDLPRVCDVCSASRPRWVCNAVGMGRAREDFALCDDCAPLVASKSSGALTSRAIGVYVARHGRGPSPRASATIRRVHKSLVATATPPLEVG